MTISYTPSLRLSLPGSGDLPGSWGTGAGGVNISITQLLEDSIAGIASVSITDADYTLAIVNGGVDEARKMYLNIASSGSLTQARNVICPSHPKVYIVKNVTSGGFAITLKTSGGTGISVPNGISTILYCDGTNVVDAVNYLSTLTVGGAVTFNGPVTFNAGAGTSTTSWGYLGVPYVSHSADYTLVLADSGKCMYHPASDTTARTFTIPANASVAYPTGTILCFDNEFAAGTLTIACGDTLVMDGIGSTGSRTLAAGGFSTVRKVDTTRWRIKGTLLT